jgi:hypothetical protein
VQAGVPPVSVIVAEADEVAAAVAPLEALELAPALDAPELAPAAVLGELALAPPAAAAALDVDAAQPAARRPALSSGTTSNAFFTRSPYCNRLGDALMSLKTPQPQTRLRRISRWRASRRLTVPWAMTGGLAVPWAMTGGIAVPAESVASSARLF